MHSVNLAFVKIYWTGLCLIGTCCLGQDIESQQQVATEWIESLQLDNEKFIVPDESIVRKKALKAKSQLIKSIEKAIDKSAKKGDEKTYNLLFMTNTNATLWSKYIQGDHFSRLLKHMITGTQINQGHIHEVRDSYHRWILHPSNANLMKYSEILWQMGRSYEILCELKVIDSQVDGSYVLYHSISEERVRRLENTGTKHVPVGNYYLWREFEGKPWSEMSDAAFCVTKEQQVSIDSKFQKID